MRDSDFIAVRTKLLIPELRRGQIARRELIASLEAGRAGRLTLVSAPTGFGKTSALAAWAAASPARFGWVSLDGGDDEPARFWSYVVAAIEGAAPEFPGTAARRLRGPGVSIADEVLPVLANQLARLTQPLVVVLDDYHVVSNEAIHAGVGYLLDRLPSGVHLALAGQVDPPVAAGRLRARGELNEVRAPQLRFSDEEAAALLNGKHGLRLAPEQLARVQGRTEGWVAGLNLVALSLRDARDRDDVMARMPAGDRLLADHLWDEVVARQSPERRDFLMRTSVLERLCGPLCDAVAGGAGSAATLAELEHGNLFVVPLDAERRWYRYHHLFRATLLRRLERDDPGGVGDLHRRASTWLAANGNVRGAIEHALRARDVHVAADLLKRHWLALYSDGHALETLGWIDRLPHATLAEYPEVALARGGMARAMGRPLDEVEPWLELVERAAEGERNDLRRRELAAGVARHRAMLRLMHANAGEAVRQGRLAVELRPEGSPEALSDSYFLAICLFWTAAAGEAERRLRAYLEATEPGELDVRRGFAMAMLAEAHARRGELDAAERLVEASLSTSRARGFEEYPPNEMAFVAAGIVALARGDVERAEERFEHAATLSRRGRDRIEIAHALLWLGRGRARAGDADGAADALHAAQAQLQGARVPLLVELARALEREIGEVPPAPSHEPVAGVLLSAAELRVLQLLPSDLSYREIAERLYLSLNTVRTHGQRIRRKLGASTRDEAVSAARRIGLL
jgi:LuxR family transcriptional regulator, maltose regulon positive regulatory protein